jgi:Subtilase family
MAVTATDGRERGAPSSWSAAVDALAAGMDDGQRRLIILSAGNTDPVQRRHYPNSNMTDGVHDPAQAWNALTVGGYTDKVEIDGVKWPGWQPLALPGDLSPCSCTSTTWTRSKWPIKPDMVLEAGNMATNPAHADPDYIDDALQLLSTNHDFTRAKSLTSFGDTSAATALAAHMAATLSAKYPAFLPETIRALMVHSADWTPAMRARFTDSGAFDYEALLRCFGYGVVNLRRLISSADNSLTLISQGMIEPFFKEDSRIKTREMRLHALPWPIDVLRDLQNAPVTMRVTLSYFIEPSPGSRGWTSKYGYQSFGLRFAVKQPLETPAQFERRINKFVREEDYDAPDLQDTGNWRFGYARRTLISLGSVRSDVWSGTAADLAARDHIAVYPTFGWWNKRGHLGSWNKDVRYSLVVTISTPDEAVDIYTPVATEIGVPIVIET